MVLSLLHGGCGPTRQDHLLHAAHPHLLHRLTHANSHVVQQRLVALEAGVRVALDVGRPLVLGRVGVPGAHVSAQVLAMSSPCCVLLWSDVLCLELLKLLLRAKFVCHYIESMMSAVSRLGIVKYDGTVQVEELHVLQQMYFSDVQATDRGDAKISISILTRLRDQREPTLLSLPTTTTMPRRRRSESELESPEPPPQRRRTQNAASDEDGDEEASGTDIADMSKKLVRLALSSEFQRRTIRRADISEKVLGTSGSRKFKDVWNRAQGSLRDVFGVEMVELPVKEKVTLQQRRGENVLQSASFTSTDSCGG